MSFPDLLTIKLFHLSCCYDSPFWGEEYIFDIPIKFRMLSFYIYEKDKLKRSDSAIGKVALRRGELHKCQSKDQWYPLTPIDQDTEVQVSFNSGTEESSSHMM